MRRRFGYGEYKAPPPSLRVQLITDGYRDEVEPVFFEPSKDRETPIEEQFAKLTTKWLLAANQAYRDRPGSKGVWYAEDYIKMKGNPTDKVTSIVGLTNSKFWDITVKEPYLFRENGGVHTPSKLLNSFFQGPTFADCASVLQACQYRALEELIGTESFNHHFGKSLTPFMVTPILFSQIYSSDSSIARSNPHIDPRSAGNPLYHLFRDKRLQTEMKQSDFTVEATLTDKDITPGDVIYLKGVDKYTDKHLEGVYPGWNLLCIGRNKTDENLYVSFGPDTFDSPKTIRELSKALIDGYNKDQSLDTKEKTRQLGSDSRAVIAKELASDKVGYDYLIVGIQYALTIDPMRLKYFVTERAKSHPLPWHSAPEQTFPLLTLNKPREVRTVTPFSTENEEKDFINYEVRTETQRQMASTARKFARAVVSRKEGQPVGFVMTGLPGIGKTHLCVATAKMAAQAGADVLFLDSNSVGNKYQQLAEENGGIPISDEALGKVFDEWIGKADLVVFDDLNSEFGVGNMFFKKAIEYSIKNNKAILISSNEHVNIKKHLPDYIGYDSPFADNFCVMSDLKGVSYRKEWWNGQVASTEISKMSASQKVELLAKYTGSSPAAVAVESDDIDLSSVKQAFLKDSSIAPEKVRVVGSPTMSKWCNRRNMMLHGVCSPDYFMHDADNYDAFVMKVTTLSECEQLLKLIPKIHDKGKQVVVVTDNQENFGQLVKETLSGHSYREEKQRLTDRIEHLFLEDVFKVRDKEVVEEKPKSKPPIEQPLTVVFPDGQTTVVDNARIERMRSRIKKVNSETHEALQVGASPLFSEQESKSWTEAVRQRESKSKDSGVNYPW